MANQNKNTNSKSSSRKGGSAPDGSFSAKKGSGSGRRKQTTDFEKRRKNKNITFEREDEVEEDYSEERPSREAFGRFSGKNKTIRDEVTLIITGLVSVLLILSYLGKCGILGNVLNTICFGFTGVFAYVLPFYIFALVAFILYNTNKYVTNDKILLSTIGVIIICAIIHMFTVVNDIGLFFESFKYGYKYTEGGGFLGGLLAEPLNTLVGKAAAIIILFAFLLIVIILITGKAILHAVKDNSKKGYDKFSEKNREYRERRAKERFEREALEGAQKYEYITTEGNKLYDLKVGGESSQSPLLYEQVPRRQKKNLSFIDKLKNGHIPGTPAGAPEAPVVREPKEEKKAVQTENDMFEITPDDSFLPETPATGGDIWKEELQKKFGNKSNSKDRVYDSYITPSTAPSELPFETPKVTPAPAVSSGKAFETVTQSETGIKSAPNLQSDADGFMFARGDYIPPEGREVVSHSTKIDQHITDRNVPPAPAPGTPVKVKKAPRPKRPYVYPSINLLNRPEASAGGMSKGDVAEKGRRLCDILASFDINAKLVNTTSGPSVTRYELQPEMGVKISKITSLADNIMMGLAATSIRIEAPIPGKSAVGIEVPNDSRQTVYLRSLLDSAEFKNSKSKVTFAVGKNLVGKVIVADIAKMPHLLIAGTTGSGKSFLMNSLIMSILYKASPEEVRLIMVDPKQVEFSIYSGIPHLLLPVVTNPEKATGALAWAVREMNDRYKKFADLKVRDIDSYNEKLKEHPELVDDEGNPREKMFQILFIIDELADLMMTAKNEVEGHICRLAQLARAAGIHLVVATQRPSVDVVTGLIKANIPSRVCLTVNSQIDSRTILDTAGGEKLLGRGDMLFLPIGQNVPERIQGAFYTDKEREDVVEFIIRKNGEQEDNGLGEEIEKLASTASSKSSSGSSAAASSADGDSEYDELAYEIGQSICKEGTVSIGNLQRHFRIGFNRAARIVDKFCEDGVVGESEGTKARKVNMSPEQFEAYAEAKGIKH